jgi:hypothetical protein
LNGIIWDVKRRKKKPQIFLARARNIKILSLTRLKEVFVVAGLLLLAFILRLVYLSHLKVNDSYFYQPTPCSPIITMPSR